MMYYILFAISNKTNTLSNINPRWQTEQSRNFKCWACYRKRPVGYVPQSFHWFSTVIWSIRICCCPKNL